MEAILQKRICSAHPEKFISHLCLKEECGCAGIICEQCIKGKHGHIKVCKIDREQPPLAYFNINSSSSQRCYYFSQVIDDIHNIWAQGNQILGRQIDKIQNTILFQLTLMCKTFAYQTPHEIEQNLRYQGEEGQSQTVQPSQSINLLRSLDKNIRVIQNLDQIQQNTEKAYKKIAVSLKHTFRELNTNFQQLNETLNKVDIFQKPQLQFQQQHLRSKEIKSYESLTLKPKPSSSQDQQTINQNKQQNKQKCIIKQTPQAIIRPSLLKQQPMAINIEVLYKQNERFCLTNSNKAELQTVCNNIKYLKIKYCKSPEQIFEYFIGNDSIEYLVIQEKKFATSQYLQLIVSCLHKLKVMVLPCTNEISKCASALSHFDVNCKEAFLDRLQYFFDFRRDLEELDEDRYFPKKMFSIKFGQQRSINPEKQILSVSNDFGQLAYWEQSKTFLGLAQALQLQQKFNLKNIWIADLSKSNFAYLKEEDINFKNIEEAIIGYHDQPSPFLPIPTLIQSQLIKASNLKSLVLIKTSHFVLSFSSLLKKLTNLDVLVLEQFKCEGDQKDITKLYNSIGVTACPNLQKLLITDLKNMSLNFITNLPFLTTLILPRSKNLQFDASTVVSSLKHLNLYGSDWDYASLINSLLPKKITHLNLGMGKTEFKMIASKLKDFCLLQSLCLDGMNLNEQFLSIIEKNQRTLQKLSLALCNGSSLQTRIPEHLSKCKLLSVLDVHKLNIEQQIIDNYPLSLKTIIINNKKSTDKLKMRKLKSVVNLSIIEVR